VDVKIGEDIMRKFKMRKCEGASV